MRSPLRRTLLFIVLLSFTTVAAAQGLSSDPFTSHLIGTWSGVGTYDGNTLALTRSWTLVLNNQFLRGDMAVTMENGASFEALTFWTSSQSDEYQIVWMDGIGRMQTNRAMRDPTSGLVSSEFVDAFAEDGPEMRRWEFEVSGANTYTERLFRLSGEDWVLLTEWSFERFMK